MNKKKMNRQAAGMAVKRAVIRDEENRPHSFGGHEPLKGGSQKSAHYTVRFRGRRRFG